MNEQEKKEYIELSTKIDVLTAKYSKSGFKNKKEALEHLNIIIPLFKRKYALKSNFSDRVALKLLERQRDALK